MTTLTAESLGFIHHQERPGLIIYQPRTTDIPSTLPLKERYDYVHARPHLKLLQHSIASIHVNNELVWRGNKEATNPDVHAIGRINITLAPHIPQTSIERFLQETQQQGYHLQP